MAQGTGYVNRARIEVERMPWPNYISDPDGDRERAYQRRHRRDMRMRNAALFMLFVVIALGLMLLFGGLR
jgi:hypothetical protein